MKWPRVEWKFTWFERIPCVLLVILLAIPGHVFAFDNSTDTFVEKCRVDCTLHKDVIHCGRYRVVRWLYDVVREKEFSYGPIRVVRISAMSEQSILPKFPQSRIFKSDAIETLNFIRDIAEDLLTKRVVVYTIDNSVTARSLGSAPMIMDEDELSQMRSGKVPEGNWRLLKKKKSIILPILILLNLLKLKLLLLPIFLSIHFIKKLLLLASLLAPSILSRLKICKLAQPHSQAYPYHTWSTAAEGPVDYPTGYGQDEAWSHRNDYQGNVAYMGYHGVRNPYG
ncbi:PREDICTED: uncharacterized protein LOC108556245 [Eufriesea mexicana]|uniref:uncharacterized protein LOC108556245 n=1 Tax=Eufriesea mexicana TaxID=516756 RepID=UPI00083C79CD|nr:PREDICTED: uncharacterized protein LOC108556245 [Eufriesea mexicana]